MSNWDFDFDDDYEFLRRDARRFSDLTPVHPVRDPKRVEDFLAQRRYWVNANMEQVKIKDMDESYLLNTMHWLISRIEHIALTYDLACLASGRNRSFPLDETWLRATPLFKRMEERYIKLLQA